MKPAETFPKSTQKRAALIARILPAAVLSAEPVKILARIPIDSREKIAVACSGGADSVAALLLVWAHFPALRGKLLVLNFNHGTRPECAAEARFVKKLAGELGEQFVGGKICIKKADTKFSGKSEDALRRHRLAFFAETMRAYDCRILIQGHHAGDVVESVLMRLARGSGTGGLCVPRPVQQFPDGRIFVRPLLTQEKEKIVSSLRSAGIAWREDASNPREDYLRNRIRKNVVPAWKKAQGASPTGGVLRARMLLEEDDAALEAWLDLLWKKISGDPGNAACRFARAKNKNARKQTPPAFTASTDRKPTLFFNFRLLKNLPRALHRRALHCVLSAAALNENISAALADEIVDALAGGVAGKWSAGKKFLKFDGKILRVEGDDRKDFWGNSFAAYSILPATKSAAERRRRAADTSTVSAELISLSQKKFSDITGGKIPPEREVFLNARAVAGKAILVRPMRAGDAFRPLGAPGSRKLSDIFIDKKIPPELRRTLPVICDDEGILWVPGLPPAHRCRLKSIENPALRLTWPPVNVALSVS